MDSYLKRYLRKGVPPLFILLERLWSDSEKLKVLENLLSRYRYNMEHHHILTAEELDDTAPKDDPSTFIWLNYFNAQFLAYKKQYEVK